jgi:hypothetical protein
MELTKKERRKIIAFDIALIFIILGGMALTIHIYNKTAGKTCETNFDCKFHCPAGSFNENFINIYRSPFGTSDCSEGMTAVCEDNKCRTYDAYDAASIEECERIGGGFYEFICYLSMAKKQGNATYCDEIPYDFDRSYCYFELARTQNDLSLCGGVSDADLKETCARELIEVPSDYKREPPYDGDCGKRPPYTVCLTFSDGYTWFVYDEILDIETQVGEGHTIEIGRGKKSDYYHILYTDFVKEVGN